MKTTSSCVLNSTAILDAIRSRECEILFEFQVKSRLVALPEKWNCGSKHVHLSDGMRRPVSTGCDKLPMIDVLKAQRKGDRQCRRLALDRAGDSLQSQRVSVGQFTNFRFGRILVRLRLNR